MAQSLASIFMYMQTHTGNSQIGDIGVNIFIESSWPKLESLSLGNSFISRGKQCVLVGIELCACINYNTADQSFICR